MLIIIDLLYAYFLEIDRESKEKSLIAIGRIIDWMVIVETQDIENPEIENHSGFSI